MMPWIKSSAATTKWGDKQHISVACLQQTFSLVEVKQSSQTFQHTQLHFLPSHQRERPQKRCCRGNDMQHHTSNVSWRESATERGVALPGS